MDQILARHPPFQIYIKNDMKPFLHILFILLYFPLWSQVGIHTTIPSATLDVVGKVKINQSLFLENPGNYLQIRGSRLLIRTKENQIIKYNIDESKYGPINSAQFVFRNTSTNGLQDYDTKIDTSTYIVTVQGYYFTAANNDTNVLLHSNLADINIEGYQIYAYPNTNTGTWFLRAFINDSTFRSGNGFVDNPIDLFLNLIIYRKGFIAKTLQNITVSMENSETGMAPLPLGF